MTITSLDLDNARRHNVASRAQLEELGAGLVPFLDSGAHQNPDAADDVGTIWTLWRNFPEDGGPCLVVGFRGDRGLLTWYNDGENEKFVPDGTTLIGQDREYWTGGQPTDRDAGEELPIAYVNLALGEYIASGERPTIVRWVPAETVPDARRPEPLENNATFLAWQQAAG